MQKAVLIATVMGVLAASSLAAEDRRTVSVGGHGELEVEPDVATVSMGIFVFDADLAKAKREADGKIAALLETFGKMGIEPGDIRTTKLYVNPKYKDVDDKWQFVGYEITRSVTVTLRKMKELNDLLDKSIEAGANRLKEVHLSSSREKELKEEALALAMANAKQNAERLASGFGAKVGKVVSIEMGGRDPFGTVMYSMSAPAFGRATFQPGRIKIDNDVHAVFELTD